MWCRSRHRRWRSLPRRGKRRGCCRRCPTAPSSGSTCSQPAGGRKEVRRGAAVALSEIENRAALREILSGPPADFPDDDDIVDPHEGWERVPPTLDQLLDHLRSIKRTYA